MPLNRTSLVVETSLRHLEGVPADSPDRPLVATYLAQVATVTFCAEIEEAIVSLVQARLAGAADSKVAHFITKTNEGMIKRVPKSDIVKTVGLFGDGAVDELNARFDEREISKYGNVVRARHITAHGAGGMVTLEEVAEARVIAERMLDAFNAVIA